MSHTLFLVFICLMLQQQWLTEAAKATCAFSEMDGVNGNTKMFIKFMPSVLLDPIFNRILIKHSN